MTRQHITISVEQLLKNFLEGESVKYTTTAPSLDETETYEIHPAESPDEIEDLLEDNPKLTFRLYPELRNRAVHGVMVGKDD